MKKSRTTGLWMVFMVISLLSSCSTTPLQNQKRDFFALIPTLPTDGDMFAKEAYRTCGPYLQTIFLLTERDLDQYDLYPILCIAGGVCVLDDKREFAVAHFSEIRHPEIKLFVGSVLFEKGWASPQIVVFLRHALQDADASAALAEIVGPHFQEFRNAVSNTELPNQEMHRTK